MARSAVVRRTMANGSASRHPLTRWWKRQPGLQAAMKHADIVGTTIYTTVAPESRLDSADFDRNAGEAGPLADPGQPFAREAGRDLTSGRIPVQHRAKGGGSGGAQG